MSESAKNAIQQDALEQSELESGATNDSGADKQQEQHVSPRMSAMDLIADSRRKALEAEGVSFDEDDGEPEKQEAEREEGRGNDQLAAQLSQDERPVYADPSLRVKVKVDGEEMSLPLAEVVKSYQKDAAASRRLQEATRLLEFAGQATNKNDPQKAIPDNNAPVAQDPPVPSKEQRREKIRSAASKLYEGDEEGFAAAIDQLFDTGAPPATQAAPIDPVQIAAHVRQQLAVESAYSEVQTDYPAVFANDERGVVLGRATVERMAAKESQGIPKSQALRESVEEVASLFGILKAGRQQTDPQRTARDEKLERKARLDTPARANVIAGNEHAPAEAPDVSATIRDMAKQRLGQSLNAK